MAVDLDKSGTGYHRARTYLGPSLGWVDTFVQPQRTITSGGTYNVQPGDSVIFVAAGAAVVINLPDVVTWVQEPAYQPATGFARSIYIKDLGTATSFPISYVPFGAQLIDGGAGGGQITQNYNVVQLVPMNDMSGWWSVTGTAGGGLIATFYVTEDGTTEYVTEDGTATYIAS